jgi:PAS domain S-box-containing protein
VVDFPESERSILDPQKIISILVLPIHVHNKFWGFIGFDDCTKKREWSSSEIGLLRSTANSFAVVIERMRAEQTLAENTWRLENIIKSTNVGTWEWNIQAGELIINDRWAQIVGYTMEELSPVNINTWEKLAHPDDLKQSMALLTKHFSGELPYYEFEGRMKHKDGHWVWISDHGKVATFSQDDKPLMMLGTHVDISERKRLEQVFIDQKEKTEVINKLMVGRELKMIELKNEIQLLKKSQSG